MSFAVAVVVLGRNAMGLLLEHVVELNLYKSICVFVPRKVVLLFVSFVICSSCDSFYYRVLLVLQSWINPAV
jgi:hypothetical protein